MGDVRKCAIWGRVSTHDQETQNQLRELNESAERRGFTIVVVYQAEVSAYKGAEDKLVDRVLHDARLGRYDVLLCWALDRLCREGVDKTLSILRGSVALAD